MTTYHIEKPEKGAGLIEYTLKYITMFFLFGIVFWAVYIFLFTNLFSNSGLTEQIYMYSFVLSVVTVLGVLGFLVPLQCRRS